MKNYRILALASEWFSHHGGLSTFNRALCGALSSAGHQVVCLVPEISDGEEADASSAGVTLKAAPQAVGLSNESRLCLPISGMIEPEIVIGHGHITGPAASARVQFFYPNARRIHFLHTLPEELEWYKDRDNADASERAQRKQETDAHLAVCSALAVAVGPRLDRGWNTYMSGVNDGVHVHRLNPGLPTARTIENPPPALECLVLGRLEDMEIKGTDIAAAAMGVIAADSEFRGPNEPTLVVRGVKPGTADNMRKTLRDIANTGILVRVKEYTHNAEQVREDMARASVVLMPSRVEGFGLVGLEALAMGVPVLVSQRSGLGELLDERISSDASMAFASTYIIDVQDNLLVDAACWADAIRHVLQDRQRAFVEVRRIREFLERSEYWPRAISELFNALDDVPRDTLSQHGDRTEQVELAHNWASLDPAVSVAMSTSLLEQEMEKVVEHQKVAKRGLRPEQYLALLRQKGHLQEDDVATVEELIRRRNKAVHEPAIGIDQSMAEAHLRTVEMVVKKLRDIAT